MKWERVRLGEHISLIGGGTPSKDNQLYWGGNIPWVTVKDFKQNIISRTEDSITLDGLNNCAAKLVPAGTLLIATRMAIGKVAITSEEVAFNQDIKAIFCKPSISKRYLFYLVKVYDAYFQSMASGATVKGIKINHILNLEIPLPPRPIQEKIANILDKADALRRKDQELQAKYDELAQSIFIDMFGDPVRNEKGWEVRKLEELMTIVRGGSPRPIDKYLGGNIPWVKIGDATKGDDIYINKTKQGIIEEGLNKTRYLTKGSVIFANCGVSLGFARILNIDGCIHDGWLAFSDIDESIVNKIFLLKSLNSVTDYFRKSAPDGTQPNLNTSIMKNFGLIIPPIDLQIAFVRKLEIINALKAKANAAKSEELFHSLLQSSFK